MAFNLFEIDLPIQDVIPDARQHLIRQRTVLDNAPPRSSQKYCRAIGAVVRTQVRRKTNFSGTRKDGAWFDEGIGEQADIGRNWAAWLIMTW